ncbi:HXXEE domain-containing protein [Notoacmeibacter ruber]|uniref:HXXEE domain-containing protein n=1 Tax=Notoacmeibacter ruber TaxID=2670375 RepID=A0A3L7JEP2_9HYPH|nr:HXXEE domain-containing protein [Notoacmeibacter ruber]RLQ89237.1 HXXEE domain-containing protein [Notoacmeibacter ruber]
MNSHVSGHDFLIGALIALVMGAAFVVFGGMPLLATFVPGLAFALGLLAFLRKQNVAMAEGARLYPLYFGTLAWQFIHFAEEYITGFRSRFPELFGSTPYSAELFVEINMISYFVFVIAFLLVFEGRRRFLLIPVLFFVIYGAIGNAIAHTYWALWSGGYFPGLFTAQLYWVLGPMLLARLLGSWRPAIVTTTGFGIVLIATLTLTMI